VGAPPIRMPPRLPLRHAVLLGLVQGPTEVLPLSSSAHIALLPRLAGWPEAQLDIELRNSLEVALHAGAAAALLAYSGMLAKTGLLAEGESPPASAKRASPESASLRGELVRGLRELDGRALVLAVLALAPPALVGYLLEQRLERRPSTPRALAMGLALGGVAMAWADLRPQARGLQDATPCDGLALGVAQALALLPGISRNGAALTAARARRFTREDAHVLSWRVGLPVIAGATALKARRLVQHGVPPGALPVLTAGATAAFLSTLASAPLIRPGRRARALWPLALYRAGLALAAVALSGVRPRGHAYRH
jgi:undecaprenyl-diphosphatase